MMYATQMLFNPNLLEVVEFRQSMIEQGVNGTQPLFIVNEGKVVSLEDDFMRLTRKCTIEELQDNNQEGSFIIFGTIQGIVEDGGWWYSACVCGKGIYPQNGAYYCDFCLKHLKIIVERVFSFSLIVRHLICLRNLVLTCLLRFKEMQLLCGDTYPPIFQGLIGKKLLLKVDTKGVPDDTFYGTFQVRRICDDPTIITMFKLPNYDADDESTPKKEPDLHKSVPCGKGNISIKEESSNTCIKSEKVAGEYCGILSKSPVLIDFLAEKWPAIFGGTEFATLINGEDGKDEKTSTNDTINDDLSAELDILLSSPEKKTQEVLSHVLDARCQYGEKLTHENDVVTSKDKRNLNPQFEEAATVADGRGSKVAKVNGSVIEGVELSCCV
ncbi:hypothetical protein Ahy_B09g097522 [Arachis hypogaea]|uniref:Replication factor A C-terminal domain-containing protein n=1 Tax=Arachis hypogaea TaxID=3818 RepID=A0A444XPC2_ARAHY|nr:hypothetical protein Ahy_B09g097522 [Arachis hypogaea]